MAFLMTLRRMKRTDLTAHGFRSSFRDWAAERTNVPRAVCEAALAHTLRDKTEAALQPHGLFERRRDLMTKWAAFVPPRRGKVVGDQSERLKLGRRDLPASSVLIKERD
jgi:integrase